MEQKNYSEQQRIAAEQNVKEKNFWLNLLSGQLEKTCLPYDRPLKNTGGSGSTYNSHSIPLDFTLDDPISSNLLRLAKGSDHTLNLLIISGLFVLLNKYTGKKDIIVGTPIYQQEIAGEFINTVLILRNFVENKATFKEFLLQMRQTIFDAVENQNYPINLLAEQLDIEGYDSDDNFPFFDIALLLENIHNREYLPHPPCNILFSFSRDRETIKGVAEYNSLLYDKTSIEKLISCFTTVLRTVVLDVNIPLAQVEIVTAEEKNLLLYDFNDATINYPKEKTIQQCFEEQVEKTPDLTAVHAPTTLNKSNDLPPANKQHANLVEKISEHPAHHDNNLLSGDRLTYRQLNTMANQIARKLRKKGVTPDSFVGIVSLRNLGMITGIIAILKAGGAYVPIDPDFPEERKRWLLEDSGAKAVLTHKSLLDDNKILRQRVAGENLLFLDDETTYSGPTDNLERLNQPDDLAYLIYTSGTTGKPKGVMISHRNVINLVAGLKERIYNQYTPLGSLKIALLSPFIFDASVKQIFGALLQGHALHIIPEEVRVDALQLMEFYLAKKIDVSDGTPAHLKMLIEAMDNSAANFPVFHFLIGGEPLSRKVVNRFFDLFKNGLRPPKITNVYGPTECCVDATCHELSGENIQELDADIIPIGKPMPNHRIYILGKNRQLTPIGEEGELCIAGDGVGRGYWKQSRLTQEKFITDPFANVGEEGENEKYEKKLYLTGDLARWRSDGIIEFLGRIDHQVKIRGFRIELEEIESLLRNHELLEDAVVMTTEGQNGEKYISAYVVPSATPMDDAREMGDQILPPRKQVKTHGELQLKDICSANSTIPTPHWGECRCGDRNTPHSVLSCFSQQVAQYGDEIAVVENNQSSDFNALNLQTHRLASVILQNYDDRYKLSPEERTRYKRQILLDGWGVQAQEKLKSTTLCVVGAGGIGSPIIHQMALLGVGTIVICDHDDVELSNLNRQFLHDGSRIGMNKALSAKITVERINPHVLVRTCQERVTQENIHEIAGDSVAIFDCVDDLETKFVLSRYAVEKQIPHVLSAMMEISSFAAILLPPHSPCFHCLYDPNKVEEIRELKRTVKDYRKMPFPVSAPALFVTTGFACNETIKIILGLENPAFNKFFLFNQNGTTKLVETSGYKQMTYAFSDHFKKISREQGFDWNECWNKKFVEELLLSSDPHCPVCGINRKPAENTKKNEPNTLRMPQPFMGTHPPSHPFQTVAALTSNNSTQQACILGALKAKKVYVHLDPSASLTYLADILEDSEARLILTDHDYLDLAVKLRDRSNPRIQVVNINAIEETPVPVDADFNIFIDPDQPAYLSYRAEPNTEATVSTLKKYLSRHVPDYMIPAHFITLNEMPLTPRGKIDRNALTQSKPETKTENLAVSPRNKMEEKLVGIWSEVLSVEKEKISIDSNFFDLGGHSLKATIIAAKIHKELNIKCPLSEVFRIPTIRKLSAFIESLQENQHTALKKVEKMEYYPLSSAQKRLFVIHQMNKSNTQYNMPILLILEGHVEINRLENTFRQLIQRHEVLRTSFFIYKDEPMQKIHQEVVFNLEYHEVDEARSREIIHAFIRPFDLTQVPILRAGLIKMTETRYLLMIDMYHIVSDGISTRLLRKDFFTLYDGEKPAPLTIQYKDFAGWQNQLVKAGEIKKQEEYWLSRFKGPLPELSLPTDYLDSSAQRLDKGSIVSRPLEPSLATKLYQRVHEMEVTVYTLLLAVFNIFLAKYTGQDDIVVGSPVAGRRHVDLEKIVGMFVNMLAMRNFPRENKSFREFLLEVKENSINAYENQDYQFEEFINKLGIIEFGKNPLCNVVFVLEQSEPEEKKPVEGDLRTYPYPFEEKTVKFDLQLEISENQFIKSISMEWNYPCALFKASTIEIMAKHYIEILNQVLENLDIQLRDISISHDLTIANVRILQEEEVSFGF